MTSEAEPRARQGKTWSVAKYGAAALAVGAGIATGPKAEALVVYTDIPDVSVFHDTFDFDVDGDTVLDFRIESRDRGGGAVLPLAGGTMFDNHVPIKSPYSFQIPALLAGTTIPDDVTLECCGNQKQFGYYSPYLGTSGEWPGVGQRFLGLAFLIGANTHYGWARLSVDGAPTLTITLFDYAYEACPGVSIETGQTSGGASCPTPSIPAPAPLALLAAGAAAVAGLRRLRKEAESV